MTGPLLITGASGNVGKPLMHLLQAAGVPVRAASRHVEHADGVLFDFSDSSTWPAAFDSVHTMFLIRPPDITKVGQELLPALEYARTVGLRHVVFLSVQGAGKVPVLPHAAVERWLRRSPLSWTFLRPSYFAQNLSTTFAPDIRDRDEIMVPAGRGRTAFVDAVDVAAVAGAVLRNPAAHAGKVWTPTGPALTFAQVATILTTELGRTITYGRPSIRQYVRHAGRELHLPPAMVAVTTALHTATWLRLAAFETDDVKRVTGVAPTTLATFVRRERAAWQPVRSH